MATTKGRLLMGLGVASLGVAGGFGIAALNPQSAFRRRLPTLVGGITSRATLVGRLTSRVPQPSTDSEPEAADATMPPTTSRQRLADHHQLTTNLGLLAPDAEKVVETLYRNLFTTHPQTRAMFPTDLEPVRRGFLKGMVELAASYEDPFQRPEWLVDAVIGLGYSTSDGFGDGFGTQFCHYEWMQTAWLAALQQVTGEHWNADVEAAWRRAFMFAAGAIMTTGIDIALCGGQAASSPAARPSFVDSG